MKKDYQKPVAEIYMIQEEENIMLSAVTYGITDILSGWF